MHELTRRRFLLWAASVGLCLPEVGLCQPETVKRALANPTTRYSEQGYDYDETSPEWKQMCTALPCFAGLWWPDYSTAVLEDRIDGKPIVIQLWKGFCPRFLGRKDYPGGIGGEVGIYRRMPGRPFPPHSAVSFIPPEIYEAVRAKAGHDLWWAAPDLNTRVEFDLINPRINQLFFHAAQQTTYWRNKWMHNASYKKYRQAAKHTPVNSWNYAMRFTVNGKTYPIWADHK